MENRKNNIDDVLAGSIVVQKVGVRWGWMFSFAADVVEAEVPSNYGYDFQPQGQHATPEDALKAGIAYIRLTKPQLVREALRIAVEGEQYRTQKGKGL